MDHMASFRFGPIIWGDPNGPFSKSTFYRPLILGLNIGPLVLGLNIGPLILGLNIGPLILGLNIGPLIMGQLLEPSKFPSNEWTLRDHHGLLKVYGHLIH